MSAALACATPASSFPELIRLAREGSREAVGRLLEVYRPYLLLIAGETLSPALRAKAGGSDLVQDTFLDAQRSLAGFGGDSEDEWRDWLRQILQNNVLDAARRFSTRKRDLDHEQSLGAGGDQEPTIRDPSPSSQAARRELDAALEAAVARLPGHYREVLLLRNHDGLPFEAIGRRLGNTADGARKLWSRAVERLQELLDAAGMGG
jgi:RNA polymerase sigma-70 factor (ECF subfamily)